MQVENQYAFLKKVMNIGLGNLIIRLSFSCRLPDIKIAWINLIQLTFQLCFFKVRAKFFSYCFICDDYFIFLY